MNCLIKNARICDPASGIDRRGDFCVEDGVISAEPASNPAQDVLQGDDLVVTPGFIDIHVHFREPGGEESETIETGSRAAARGGFTHVVTMPNTSPPIDTQAAVLEQIKTAQKYGLVHLLPSACATTGRAGSELTDLHSLAEAGAVAFTDDGSAVADPVLMKKILTASEQLGRPFMQHSVDVTIAKDGVIRDCALARDLNLPVFPSEAEASLAARDIEITAKTGGHLHIQHISTQEVLELLRSARQAGLNVTSEVTPHHLAFSTRDIRADDPNMKMNPPLGTPTDREALLQGVADGTVTCFATDHAPHSEAKKAGGFASASFGVIGLETAAGVTHNLLVENGLLALDRWVSLWTTAPARILNMPSPMLLPGTKANVAVFKLGKKVISAADLASKSSNCPFIGQETSLDPILTICDGSATWRSADC